MLTVWHCAAMAFQLAIPLRSLSLLLVLLCIPLFPGRARAQASSVTEVVWSATLKPGNLAGGRRGCNNASSSEIRCSDSDVLSNDQV